MRECPPAREMTHVSQNPGVVKIVVLLIHRTRVSNILRSFEKPPFLPDLKRNGGWEKRLIMKVNRRNVIQLLLYYSFGLSTCIAAVLKTTLDCFSERNCHFPFVPFSLRDLKGSIGFPLVFIYQTLQVPSYAIVICSADCLAAGIMSFIVAEMKIVQKSLRNIKARAESAYKKNESVLKNHTDNETVKRDRLNVCLKETIDHHIHLLHIADEFENVISPMMLFVFAGSVVLFCFLLFRTSTVLLGSMEFVQNVMFCAAIAFQLLLYCWWGNEVVLESDRVGDAAASIDYVGTPINFQRSLCMIIVRTLRPCKFTAGKFCLLSLETYMSILQGSFSYYMVLRRMNESHLQ